MKVFCKNCKYYKVLYSSYCVTRNCIHPTNIYTQYDYEKEYTHCKKYPSDLNKNNDCENFKPSLLYKIYCFFKGE